MRTTQQALSDTSLWMLRYCTINPAGLQEGAKQKGEARSFSSFVLKLFKTGKR